MKEQEVFDIFTEQMVNIGTASRKRVHDEGLWHQTFHCWIINRSAVHGPSLLLQLRNPDKDTFPDMFDISSAGHLLAGETPEDGVRELHEELGIDVSIDALTYCGMIPEEHIVPGQFMDREFTHIYLYECEKTLSEYHFQTSKISGLFFVAFSDFEKLVHDEEEEIPSEGVIYNPLTGCVSHVNQHIRLEEIVPHSKAYYSVLFQKIHELPEGAG